MLQDSTSEYSIHSSSKLLDVPSRAPLSYAHSSTVKLPPNIHTPDDPFPLVSTPKLPLLKFVEATPLRLSNESEFCAVPFFSTCSTTSISLCDPKIESSCCLEACPRMPWAPWLEKNVWNAVAGVVLDKEVGEKEMMYIQSTTSVRGMELWTLSEMSRSYKTQQRDSIFTCLCKQSTISSIVPVTRDQTTTHLLLSTSYTTIHTKQPKISHPDGSQTHKWHIPRQSSQSL